MTLDVFGQNKNLKGNGICNPLFSNLAFVNLVFGAQIFLFIGSLGA